MNFNQHKIISITTIGFALFAMFFGAGNLILPPFIGLNTNNQWFASLLGFFITAIIAPFLGILVVSKSGETFTDLGEKIHPKLVNILTIIIILCIGPLVGIPRTGATIFEVGVKPIFPNFNNVFFSISFFTIVFVLSFAKSKIVDIIGKILTPFLLISLLILVTLGILFPIENIDANQNVTFSKSFTYGFIEGYQTLDVLGAVIFAGIIISAITNKGFQSYKERLSITLSAGLVSSTALLVIYGGLIYLGATSGYAVSENISRTDLLLHISNAILGKSGTYVIAVAISFACLTTAIALTSATGSIVEKFSSGKISYRTGVIVCTLVSMFFSINSVDEIIVYAINILLFIYPITLTVIIYTLIFSKLVKNKLPYIMTIISTAIISLIAVFENLGLDFKTLYKFKKSIPLENYQLEWLLPSFIVFIIFAFFKKK